MGPQLWDWCAWNPKLPGAGHPRHTHPPTKGASVAESAGSKRGSNTPQLLGGRGLGCGGEAAALCLVMVLKKQREEAGTPSRCDDWSLSGRRGFTSRAQSIVFSRVDLVVHSPLLVEKSWKGQATGKEATKYDTMSTQECLDFTRTTLSTLSLTSARGLAGVSRDGDHGGSPCGGWSHGARG
jgi:hypothetical protein